MDGRALTVNEAKPRSEGDGVGPVDGVAAVSVAAAPVVATVAGMAADGATNCRKMRAAQAADGLASFLL
jgi:hypothetical protein